MAQLVPLPAALIDRLDPAGAALLEEGGGGSASFRTLSLDGPATIQALGRSVAALMIFLLAFHHSASRRGRRIFGYAVGIAGVVAVLLGLGHRLFAVGKIYGIFELHRAIDSILIGPFINANHNAEFLELATFVSLAMARQAASPVLRMGWIAATVTCAAGAVATLSRASVLALGCGLLVLIVGERLVASSEPSSSQRRRWLPAIAALVAALVVAVSIGADQVLNRFVLNPLHQDVRFALWRDSLTVLRNHPFGIGRGAFDVVYPAYRTLEIPFPLRFPFVENQPLQMLIDFGWIGIVVLVAAAIVPVRTIWVRGRHDRVEVALVAALAAVCTHSVADFGLETLGVLLPFFAVLGMLLGRAHSDGAVADRLPLVRNRAARLLPLATAGVAVAVVGATAFGDTGRNFDRELAQATAAPERREVIMAARRAHPVDYFFPMALAPLEPVTPDASGRSPRLRALNQALRLCMNCPDVHLQVARTLWQLGRRSQSLAEWRTAARGQAALFEQSLPELLAIGANATEMAQIAGGDPKRLLQVAYFWLTARGPKDLAPVVALAKTAGAGPLDLALLRAKIASASGDRESWEAELARAKAAAGFDGRVAELEADLIISRGGAEAGVAALSTIEHALEREPSNVSLQRKRLQIVMQFKRWSALDRAVIGFKQALNDGGRSVTEAHVLAASAYMEVGRVREAVVEYRIATTAEPNNIGIWQQFGASAEAAGRLELAHEAFVEAARLRPNDPRVVEDLQRIQAAQMAERRKVPLE